MALLIKACLAVKLQRLWIGPLKDITIAASALTRANAIPCLAQGQSQRQANASAVRSKCVSENRTRFPPPHLFLNEVNPSSLKANRDACFQVTVTGKPLSSFPTLTCHCNSCKRRSGGIASYAFVVPKQHVQFNPAPSFALGIGAAATATATATASESSSSSGSQRGATTPGEEVASRLVHTIFVDKDTGSGHPMQRTLCVECGSPVCIVEASDPDARCLQFGLFAGVRGASEADGGGLLSECRPQLEMFASRRVKWMPEVGQDVREEV